jgi:hypothetical protein
MSRFDETRQPRLPDGDRRLTGAPVITGKVARWNRRAARGSSARAEDREQTFRRAEACASQTGASGARLSRTRERRSGSASSGCCPEAGEVIACSTARRRRWSGAGGAAAAGGARARDGEGLAPPGEASDEAESGESARAGENRFEDRRDQLASWSCLGAAERQRAAAAKPRVGSDAVGAV